jgi:hypothetical protein
MIRTFAFVLSNVGRDKSIVYEYDITARKQKEVLFEHKLFNAGSMLINRHRSGAVPFGEIMGIGCAGPRGDDIQWTSPRKKALTRAAQARHPPEPLAMVDTANGQRYTANYDTGLSYRIVDYTADLSNVLVATSGPSNPPEYHLLHDGKLTLLAKTYPQIQPAAPGTTRLVYYKARDGLDIPASTTPSTELCGAGPWKAGASARRPVGTRWHGLRRLDVGTADGITLHGGPAPAVPRLGRLGPQAVDGR